MPKRVKVTIEISDEVLQKKANDWDMEEDEAIDEIIGDSFDFIDGVEFGGIKILETEVIDPEETGL